MQKMIFCFQNCFYLLWENNVLVIEEKLLKSEAEGWEFSKKISITKTIYPNSESSKQLLKQNAF